MENKSKKILITGGHLTPAIAVLMELKSRGYSNFIWVGHKFNQAGSNSPTAEFKTVESLNIPFKNLKTGKLIRDWSLNTFIYGIKNLFFILIGFMSAFIIILKEKPIIVVSFGGYLALPIVIAAKLLAIKIVTHEQTIVTGLANKIISRFANKILISWESSAQYFNKSKTVFTGNPIRESIYSITDMTLLNELDNSLPTVLVYGGNQGAHEINKRVFEIIEDLLKDFNVIHQTGSSNITKDNERSLHIKSSLSLEIKNRYLPIEYINGEHVGAVLNNAEIIIGRSGANTITEILALCKLCILIPIPQTSHDEQIKNAKLVESIGLAMYLDQKNLTSQKLYQSILLLRNQLKLNKAVNNKALDEVKVTAKKLIKTDAAKLVVNEIETLI